VRLLKGKTLCGDAVFDSPSQPADLQIQDQQAPFIGVYTDDADVTLHENSLAGGTSRVYLILECAVGEQMAVDQDQDEDKTHGQGGGDDEPATPRLRLQETDDARELMIGLVARQANQAFLATDNQWAELWRILVPTRVSVEVRRGGPPLNRDAPAIRFASRVMRYTLEILDDPVWGQPLPEGFWTDFLAAIEADADFGSDVAELLRAQFEYPAGPLPSWRVAQKLLTITRPAIAAIGLAPVVIPDETEAPMARQGRLDPGGKPVLDTDPEQPESALVPDGLYSAIETPVQPLERPEDFLVQPETDDETPEGE
jgi:hypothetical protein